mmetsp:Transcript_6531/g.12038  ORF Transcript_6531/g.12038 Transcript_6531/m.12038 type:complete len:916 (+) Transcript_6531:552-3299(+)
MDDSIKNLGLNPDYLQPRAKFSAIPYVVDTLDRSNASQNAEAKTVSELFPAGVSEAERQVYEHDLSRVRDEVQNIVEDSYEGFTSSLSSFRTIFKEFTEAQTKVRKLKEYVHRSKETLVNRKRNLKDLWFQKMQHVRALELVAEIQAVQEAPKRLEHLLRNEQFVECVELFQTAFTKSFGEELGSISALGQVREDLVNYREKINELLIRALVGYLSSPESMPNPTSTALTGRPGRSPSKSGATSPQNGNLILNAPRLSSEAIVSLDSIVHALDKLGRLSAALHTVKSSLREQLNSIARKHLDSGKTFRRPPGLTVSEQEVNAVRVENLFHAILGEYQALFSRHAQFADILESVPGSSGSKNYSIQETWSTVQVEVQELLELHLAQSSYAFEQQMRERQINVSFTFSQGRSLTLEKTRGKFSHATAGAQRQPICTPSPHLILGLIKPVVNFAKYGDELADMTRSPQLKSYVAAFCQDNLAPRLQEDILLNLSVVTGSDLAWDLLTGASAIKTMNATDAKWNCCTHTGTVLCKELGGLATCAVPLAQVGASVSGVVAACVEHVVESARDKVDTILRNSHTKDWLARLKPLLKEDPSYAAIISVQENEDEIDPVKIRQERVEYNRRERAEERKVVAALRALHDVSSDHTAGHLTPANLAALAAIHSTCDLLFRTLARQAAADGAQLGPGVSSSDIDATSPIHPGFLALMDTPAMAHILGLPELRRLFVKLDQLAEDTIFALRSELRIRCVTGLKALPSQVISKGNSSTVAVATLSHELVKAMRAMRTALSEDHSAYVIRGLCALQAESVIDSLRHIHSSKAKLTRSHLSQLDLTIVTLQQTMWTVLLSTVDNATSNAVALSRDQLAAFDGARRFLQCLDAQDATEAEKVFEFASDTILSGLSIEELRSIRNLFDQKPL